MIEIRRAGAGDAARLLELQHALDGETRFMMLEPGERTESVGALTERLAGQAGWVLLAVDEEGLAAGYVEVEVVAYARARRTGYVVMGVRGAFAGQGLGRRLLTGAAEEARAAGMRRLELTVMAHNVRALGLYATCGYRVEGLRRSALDVDGERVDEYYMGLLLE